MAEEDILTLDEPRVDAETSSPRKPTSDAQTDDESTTPKSPYERLLQALEGDNPTGETGMGSVAGDLPVDRAEDDNQTALGDQALADLDATHEDIDLDDIDADELENAVAALTTALDLDPITVAKDPALRPVGDEIADALLRSRAVSDDALAEDALGLRTPPDPLNQIAATLHADDVPVRRAAVGERPFVAAPPADQSVDLPNLYRTAARLTPSATLQTRPSAQQVPDVLLRETPAVKTTPADVEDPTEGPAQATPVTDAPKAESAAEKPLAEIKPADEQDHDGDDAAARILAVAKPSPQAAEPSYITPPVLAPATAPAGTPGETGKRQESSGSPKTKRPIKARRPLVIAPATPQPDDPSDMQPPEPVAAKQRPAEQAPAEQAPGEEAYSEQVPDQSRGPAQADESAPVKTDADTINELIDTTPPPKPVALPAEYLTTATEPLSLSRAPLSVSPDENTEPADAPKTAVTVDRQAEKRAEAKARKEQKQQEKEQAKQFAREQKRRKQEAKEADREAARQLKEAAKQKAKADREAAIAARKATKATRKPSLLPLALTTTTMALAVGGIGLVVFHDDPRLQNLLAKPSQTTTGATTTPVSAIPSLETIPPLSSQPLDSIPAPTPVAPTDLAALNDQATSTATLNDADAETGAAVGTPAVAAPAPSETTQNPDDTSVAAIPTVDASEAPSATEAAEPVRLATPAPLPLPAELQALEASATEGNRQAQHDLGAHFAAGRLVDQDFSRAAYWFQEAAIRGVANAQYNLGVLLQQGLGVEPDANRAVEWYRRAAENGHVEAQYNMGVAYADGIGIGRDIPKAVRWFEQAAAAGIARAAFNLGVMYEVGMLGRPDLDAARQWYRQAATSGDRDADDALARLNGE